MKNMLVILFVSLMTGSVFAKENAKIKALEKRIQLLEERISKLEASNSPVADKVDSEKRKNRQRLAARQRMRKDLDIYSREQLREIETLYQVANKKWRTEEGKESLKKLIEKYDKANRTGCALLYLGQMSKGKKQEEYLKKAIDGFSDCFYGDGVQVGAYARFYLAHYYKKNGQSKKADELFQEIKTKYPDAIDHRGRFLADYID